MAALRLDILRERRIQYDEVHAEGWSLCTRGQNERCHRRVPLVTRHWGLRLVGVPTGAGAVQGGAWALPRPGGAAQQLLGRGTDCHVPGVGCARMELCEHSADLAG